MQNIGGAINSFRNAMNNPNPGTNINAQGGAGNQPYVETPLPQTQTQIILVQAVHRTVAP